MVLPSRAGGCGRCDTWSDVLASVTSAALPPWAHEMCGSVRLAHHPGLHQGAVVHRPVPGGRESGHHSAMSGGRGWQVCQQRLATRQQLVGVGWSSRALDAAVRSGEVVRLHRGVYAPAPRPVRAWHLVRDGRPDPGFVAQVRAALLSLGGHAVAAERTAAVLWGLDLLVEPQRIDVHVPRNHNRAERLGVLVHRRGVPAAELAPILGLAGMWVTTPLQTVVDCAVTRPLREAVVIVDSALRSGLLVLDDLVAGLTLVPGARYAARLRRVLALVDPSSGSVLESVLRVLMVQAGLRPLTQVTLLDRDGNRIGIVDFWFREARLVVECDGRRWHDPQDARDRDRLRDNETARIGCRTLRFTWDDVMHRPDRVLATVRDCLALAA